MFELKNYSEVIVKKVLAEYLQKTNIPCKCEKCQADIMAFALNRLPPKYYVSLKGEVLTSLESHMLPDKTRVWAEVVAASQLVASQPSHSVEDR